MRLRRHVYLLACLCIGQSHHPVHYMRCAAHGWQAATELQTDVLP